MTDRPIRAPDLLRDRLLAADPGGAMARYALRVTVTVAVAVAALAGVAALLDRPLQAFVIGTLVAMLASVVVQDPTPAAQRRTMALLPLAAAVSATLAVLASASEVAGAPLFVVVMFFAVWIRRFGERFLGVGMVAFMSYFFVLFVGGEPGQLPWMYLSLVVAMACAFLVRFVLLPDRPLDVRRAQPALRAQIRLILWDLGRIVRGRARARHHRRIGARVTALNEVVLTLRDQGDAEARLALFDAELAVQRLDSLAGRDRTDEEREAILHDLRALYHVPATPEGRAIAWRTHPDDRFGSALRNLVEALDREALHRSREPDPEPADEAPRPADDEGEAPEPGLLPTTRTAIQVAVAGALAIVGGEWLVPGQWHWAVMTAFVIFTGTSSRGDVLVKSWRRVFGMGLGVVVGAALATLVGGNRPLTVALILGSIFAGFYLIRASYMLMMFWITVMIALLYHLLGMPGLEMLQIRVEETILGAIVGIVIAGVLLPTKTKPKVEAEGRKLLEALGEVVDACRRRLEGEETTEELLDAVRDLDAAFQSLRQAGEPLAWHVPLTGPRASQRWLEVLPLLVYEAHALVGRTRRADVRGEALAPAWSATTRRLQERIEPLAEAIAAGRATALSEATVQRARRAPWPGEGAPSPYALPEEAGPEVARIARSLSRIDWIVTVLARNLDGRAPRPRPDATEAA